jgi:hypothetical protein
MRPGGWARASGLYCSSSLDFDQTTPMPAAILLAHAALLARLAAPYPFAVG